MPRDPDDHLKQAAWQLANLGRQAEEQALEDDREARAEDIMRARRVNRIGRHRDDSNGPDWTS